MENYPIIQYKWHEKDNTFSKITKLEENKILVEPITKEEYYKNQDW